MLEVVETIYKGGVFVPEKPFNFPEGTRVKIVIERTEETNSNWNLQESMIIDPQERQRTVVKFLERTGSRTISDDAPRKFTREELHERH